MKLVFEFSMQTVGPVVNVRTHAQECVKLVRTNISVIPGVLAFKDGKYEPDPICEEEEYLGHARNLIQAIRQLSEEYLASVGFKTPRYLEELASLRAEQMRQNSIR